MKFGNPSKKARTLSSKLGHSVEFPGRTDKGELVYVHVPPALHAEAAAAGFEPEEDLPEAEEQKLPGVPADEGARRSAMNDTFDALIARGDREDFSGNGQPKTEAMEKVLGWKPDSKEAKKFWADYQTATKE